MIVYKDIISGDELFTDVFPITLVGPNKNIIKIVGKRVTEKDSADIDIGANPSAEEQAEALEDGGTTGIDIVLQARLQEVTSYGLKDYQKMFRKYIKKLLEKKNEEIEELEKAGNMAAKVEKLKEEQETFKATIGQDMKQVVMTGYEDKDFQFFAGENMDVEAQLGLMTYPDNDPNPVMYFIKYGLVEEKC